MSLKTVAPIPQMLSRWYLFFMTAVLTVFGIALLAAAYTLPGIQGYLSGPGTLFLYTAAIIIVIGAFIRDAGLVRITAGTVGVLYFAWGVVFLFVGPTHAITQIQQAMTGMSLFLILVGAMGMASALIPSLWLRYHDTSARHETPA